MASVKLSATGRVACDGSFLDMYGRRPPAIIQLVHPSGAPVSPPLMSWSAFPTSRKLNTATHAKNDTSVIAEGEHVALAFSYTTPVLSQEMFFSVGVFRCDTWALQWAVRADSVPDGRRVCDVCCLSAQTVVFLVEGDVIKTKKKASRKQLYIATKADVPRVAKQKNREWRSFLAEAHLVKTAFDSEDICGIQPLSATSCLLLTSAGRLIHVTVSFDPSVAVKSEEVLSDSGLIPLRSDTSALVLSSAVESGDNETVCYAAVFTAGGHMCHVVQLTKISSSIRASRPQLVPLSPGVTIERVEFAGPHILVVTIAFNERTTFALSMTCFVPSESLLTSSEASFRCVSFDPVRMTARRVPLATMYCPERETHIVLASRRPYRCRNNNNNIQSSDSPSIGESWWSCMEYAELQLREGPYTEEVFQNTIWRSLPEPRSSALPTVADDSTTGGNGENNNDGSNDENDDAAADLQQEMALLNRSQSGGRWELIRLYYPLAACRILPESTAVDKEKIVVNVLAVETAPFVHTRLVKQWHNATRGLRCLFDGAHGTVGGLPPFAVAWNPRHVRGAMRLFSQEGLCQLFKRVINALRDSTQESNVTSLFYGAATTAITDMALHIITLSRQVGVVLSPDDVAVVALLLRASRETGHLIVNQTTRGKLLLESVVKSRLANRILVGGKRVHYMGQGRDDINENEEKEKKEDEEEGEGEGASFLHVPTELRVERALHAKYAANAWAQYLLSRRVEDASVVASALQHLKAVVPLQLTPSLPYRQGKEDEDDNIDGNNNSNRNLGFLNEEISERSVELSDWMVLGRCTHVDSAFTKYESVLVRDTANQSTTC